MSAFWNSTLEDTVAAARKIATRPGGGSDMAEFLSGHLPNAPSSSNLGSATLPFQRWFRFKEAFSPKFVADTLGALPYRATHCLDPFLGSGTTALTCRLLGLQGTGIEINPFLADLAKSKLAQTSPSSFLASYEYLIANLKVEPSDSELPDGIPVTFREPGQNGRWIFDQDTFDTVRAIVRSLSQLPETHGRLLRVLLGSVLVENSNVRINGKGRRYRRNWQKRGNNPTELLRSLDRAVDAAIHDLTRYSDLSPANFNVLCGDAREELTAVEGADVAIFSPPYPNSFDYTDVYNVELWMLGYLETKLDNANLRSKTLRSHVQRKWPNTAAEVTSATLDDVATKLSLLREELWHPDIPMMIRHYAADLANILIELRRILGKGRRAIIAVGDSQYAGVHVDVGKILEEIADEVGFALIRKDCIRSMRNSSQHGGSLALTEHCLVFEAN